MKRVSKKMATQKREEAKLKKWMVEQSGGVLGIEDRGVATCAKCGKWRWVGKHEIIPRSLGGDPLDLENCILLCDPCNDWEKEHPVQRTMRKEDFPFRGPL